MQKRPVTRSQSKRKRVLQEENIEENFLEGLTVTNDGKSIVIDRNLLERLQAPVEKPIIVNPFEDFPEFLEVLKNGKPLTLEFLEECSRIRKSDPESVKMSELIGTLPLDWLALKRSAMQEDNWEYSVKVPGNPSITNQQQTGLCWCYSAMNLMRYQLMKRIPIDHKFEFSTNYVFFYDKIERSNLFLENMWNLRNRNLQDREVRVFTNPGSHFLEDGGYHTYFTNIVKKYGMVPANVYSKNLNANMSSSMNETLVNVLNHMALDIFRNKDNWSRDYFEDKKDGYMRIIYDLVVRFLGEPPKPNDNFNWHYRDDHGDSHTIPNLTPLKFYRTIVPHDHDTKVTIIHDPRHPETYFQKSFVEYSLNVQGGTPLTMINLPQDIFKKVIYENLRNEEACWMGCDIGKCLDSENNTSDTKRFDYKSILGTAVEFDKCDMLDMLTSAPTHAMVFNGVDTVNDKDGNVVEYVKWRIDNSWGRYSELESEPDYGFWKMTDDYFNKYVYMAVVDLKYFEEQTMFNIIENSKKGNVFTYASTDAFGCVAMRNCEHCSKNKPKRLKNKMI